MYSSPTILCDKMEKN